MSMAPQLDRYLSVRRSLGYDLRTDERILRRFTRFADQEGAAHMDTALFLRWDASLPDVGTSTRSARFGKVRLFAQSGGMVSRPAFRPQSKGAPRMR